MFPYLIICTMMTNIRNILNININPNRRLTLSDIEKIPSSLPCIMGWKDRNSNYLGISDFMIDYAGLEPRNVILGKNDSEIKRFEIFSEHYMYWDKFAMNRKPIQLTERLLNNKNELINICSSKFPIFNSALDKTIGVFFFGVPICNILSPHQVISRQLANLHRPIILSSTHYIFDLLGKQKVELTKKESEVLYYYLRGRTSKQIALELFLSSRTVEDHICSIKNKLHCDSRAQIVDLVITLGLFDFVPMSLMNT